MIKTGLTHILPTAKQAFGSVKKNLLGEDTQENVFFGKVGEKQVSFGPKEMTPLGRRPVAESPLRCQSKLLEIAARKQLR